MTVPTRSILEQIASAYRRMASEGRYRPAAPSDLLGNITVPLERLDLERGALDYARRWWREEDEHDFFVGCCNYLTRPATIYALEGARLMCGGDAANPIAPRLLRMAVAELEKQTRRAA